jgi:uncharacterized protein YjiS (DUF1127 family)
MQKRRREVGAHMPVRSERLAPGRASGEDWTWIDPTVFMAEGRRLHARAMAEAFRSAVDGVAAVVRRLGERLAGRSARHRAVHQLSGLDDRLLADIGLRRGDIELAVDGGLTDPRMRRQAAMAELVLEGRDRAPAPANSNRSAPPLPEPGLAA